MPLSPTSSRGGFSPVTCVLSTLAAIDIHAVGSVTVKWNVLSSDQWIFPALAAVPAALGLSITLDGVASDIAATVSGVWAFNYWLKFTTGADAALAGDFGFPNATGQGFYAPFANVGDASTDGDGIAYVASLPSGAHGAAEINTYAAAVANPYNVRPFLAITRLA